MKNKILLLLLFLATSLSYSQVINIGATKIDTIYQDAVTRDLKIRLQGDALRTVPLQLGSSTITNFALNSSTNILTLTLDNGTPVTVDLNTIGITTSQSNAIVANTAKVGITPQQTSDITANNSKVGITTAQSNAIVANTNKVGITTGQANEISANTLKIGLTDGSVTTARIADNAVTTAKILDGTILEADLAPAVVTKLNTAALPTVLANLAAFEALPTAQKIALGTYIFGQVPTGYSVDINQASIDAANQTAFSFTFANAVVNDSYDYSIASSGGGVVVSGYGTIATANAQITGIDVTGLNNGTLTLSAFLTNLATSAGVTVTDNVVKNIPPPIVNIFINRAGSAQSPSSTSMSGWVSGNGTSTSSTVQARTGTTSLRVASNIPGTEQFRSFDNNSGSTADITDWTNEQTVTITGFYFKTQGTASLTAAGTLVQLPDTSGTWQPFSVTSIAGTVKQINVNATHEIFLDDLIVSINN